jgi:aminopeptidase N
MLRMMMRQNGADPDRAFMSMLRELVETYSGQAVSTWDFKRVAEKQAAADMDWFFDQWVFANGIPAYTLNYKVESDGGALEVEGTVTQTGAPDGFSMPLPIYADGELLGRVTVTDETEEFRFRVEKKPERVVIDPFETVLRKTGL